jgi:hypothetical protein
MLKDWIKALPSSFFIAPSAATSPHFATLSAWTNSQSFTSAAVSEFFRKADFLVAQAYELGYTVITNEVPDVKAKNRVKIPTACMGIGAQWTNTFGMLRAERVRFFVPSDPQMP